MPTRLSKPRERKPGHCDTGKGSSASAHEEPSRPWHDVWPAHLSPSLSYPDVPIWWILERNLATFAGRTAVRFLDHRSLAETESYSYADVAARARALAVGLRRLGVKKGDRVAICLPNSPQLIIGFYGIWLCGAVAAPCNPMLTVEELARQLGDAEAGLLIASGADPAKAAAVAERMKLPLVLTRDGDAPQGNGAVPFAMPFAVPFDELLAEDGASLEPPPIDPEADLALLLYTGGTTGASKGAMLTHRNIVANTIQFAEWYAFEPGGETTVSVIPMFHSGGLAGAMNVPLYAGATLLVMSRFNPLSVARAIENYRATRFFGVPTMFIALLNHGQARGHDFSSLKACRTNAAPLPVSVKAAFDDLVGHEVLVEGYGLTETSPLTHANPIAQAKAGSIGIPLPDTDARIVDLKTGQALAPGEQGEIVLKGPQVMKGYWKQPEETAAAIRDGWFHTGDVGFMDEQGYFTVVDRLKDVINTAGYKVWPREVEEVIYKHPAVKLAAVVGVEDDYHGEIVKAFVVPKDGRGGEVTQEKIIALCKENLAAYKAPREVVFRSELPVSGVGKMLRRVLREEGKGG